MGGWVGEPSWWLVRGVIRRMLSSSIIHPPTHPLTHSMRAQIHRSSGTATLPSKTRHRISTTQLQRSSQHVDFPTHFRTLETIGSLNFGGFVQGSLFFLAAFGHVGEEGADVAGWRRLILNWWVGGWVGGGDAPASSGLSIQRPAVYLCMFAWALSLLPCRLRRRPVGGRQRVVLLLQCCCWCWCEGRRHGQQRRVRRDGSRKAGRARPVVFLCRG